MARTTRGGHDVLTLTGIGVVALAAAVLSFSSLHALAERAGFHPWLAALLPIAIDAMAVVATRAWLLAETPDRARVHARTLALAAIGMSIVGNAGEHYMTAYALTTPWPVVVAVAAVPPAALAATVHLAALLATEPAPTEADPVTSRPAVADSGLDQRGPVEQSAPVIPSRPVEARQPTADQGSAAVESGPARRSVEQLRAALAVEVEAGRVDPTSAESIRKGLRCSAKRARQLRDTAPERPRLAVVGQALDAPVGTRPDSTPRPPTGATPPPDDARESPA